MKRSARKSSFLMGVLICLLALIAGTPSVYADCDYIALLSKQMADISTLNGPYDTWELFGTEHITPGWPQLNSEGYGIIYFALTNDWRHVWDDNPAYPDQVFRMIGSTDMSAYEEAETAIFDDGNHAFLVMAHCRASSVNTGIPDPHPFIWDYNNNTDEPISYAFQHNGGINKTRLTPMITELWDSWDGNENQDWFDLYPYRTEDQGDGELVDSEAFYHWIMVNVKLSNGNVQEGLRRALIAVRTWPGFRNIVFADATSLYVYKNAEDVRHWLGYEDHPTYYAVMTGPDEGAVGHGTQLAEHEMIKMHTTGGRTHYLNFDQPRYHPLPYTNTFEHSTYALDSYWYLNSWEVANEYHRIRVAQEDGGNRYLLMDSNTDNHMVQNEATVHLNLSGQDRVRLKFNWKYFNEEDHGVEGVYFADGDTFVKVYDFSMGNNASVTTISHEASTREISEWQEVILDVDNLCAQHGLTMNSTFKVKFVQKDNYEATTDGIGIDDIRVYRAYVDPDGYTMDFESGGVDEYWDLNTNSGRIQITSNYSPFQGSYHMVMDSSTPGHYEVCIAELHVDFSKRNRTDYSLRFAVKDFVDENHGNDGILFSDDGGRTWNRVPVYQFLPQSWTNYQYQTIEIDIDQLAEDNGLSLTDSFIIRIQQYDNYQVTSDGMAFDKIEIVGSGGYIAIPDTK